MSRAQNVVPKQHCAEVVARQRRGPHDKRSRDLYSAIARIDLEKGSDYFEWKAGGEGDNGEELMALLDLYFEETDAAKRDPYTCKTCRHDYFSHENFGEVGGCYARPGPSEKICECEAYDGPDPRAQRA